MAPTHTFRSPLTRCGQGTVPRGTVSRVHGYPDRRAAVPPSDHKIRTAHPLPDSPMSGSLRERNKIQTSSRQLTYCDQLFFGSFFTQSQAYGLYEMVEHGNTIACGHGAGKGKFKSDVAQSPRKVIPTNSRRDHDVQNGFPVSVYYNLPPVHTTRGVYRILGHS